MLVAGASVPDAAVMAADVGPVVAADEATDAAEEATEVATEVAIELAGAACWLEALLLAPPPFPPRSSDWI